MLRFRSSVLRFRVLGASFSSFGCFVLRSSFSKLPSGQYSTFSKNTHIIANGTNISHYHDYYSFIRSNTGLPLSHLMFSNHCNKQLA